MKRIIALVLMITFLSTTFISAADYILAPGDTLEIKFMGESKYDTKQTIAPDGKISLPFLGSVRAEGYSVEGLRKTLTEKLNGSLKELNLVILLTPRPIYVTSHDLKTDKRETKKAESITEAKALAGKEVKELVKHGDILEVEVGERPSWWETNWYKVLSAIAIVAGVYGVVRR